MKKDKKEKMNVLKMYYSKIILTTLIIFFCQGMCYSEYWYPTYFDGKRVDLDEDSVIYQNDSLYYNVMYNRQVITIQSKGNQAGVVATYSKDNYADTLNAGKATNFKPITPDSLIYNANQLAYAIHNEKVDWGDFMKSVQKTVSNRWTPPKYATKPTAIISFMLESDAQNSSIAKNIKFIKKSGFDGFDKSCVDAVSGRYKGFPKGAVRKNVWIDFSFNDKTYN